MCANATPFGRPWPFDGSVSRIRASPDVRGPRVGQRGSVPITPTPHPARAAPVDDHHLAGSTTPATSPGLLRGRVVAVGLSVILAGSGPGFLLGSLAPVVGREVPYGSAELGLVVAAFYATSAVVAWPGGHVLDRFGIAAGLRCTCVLTAAATLGLGLLAQSPAALALCAGACGVGNGLGTPGATKLVRAHLAGRWLAGGYGAVQAGAPLGSLLAGVALPLVGVPLGWRWAFVLVTAVAVGTLALVPKDPQPAQPSARPFARLAYWGIGLPSVLIAAAIGLSSLACWGMVAFLVVFAVRSGMTEAAAGLLLAGVGVTGMLMRPLLGLLAGRQGGRRALAWAALVLGAAATGFLLLTVGRGWMLVAGAILAGGLGTGVAVLGTVATTESAPRAPAAAVGLMMTGLLGGGALGPLLAGLLVDGVGWQTAWVTGAILLLVAAGILLGARWLCAEIPGEPGRGVGVATATVTESDGDRHGQRRIP